jgi:hypothetical protein
MKNPFSIQVKPDQEGFLKNIRRQGSSKRVHYIEIYLDQEIQDALIPRFGIDGGLNKADPAYQYKKQIALQRFLGYDYVCAGIQNLNFNFNWNTVEDATDLKKSGGRGFVNETRGPITSWDEFEKYQIGRASCRERVSMFV